MIDAPQEWGPRGEWERRRSEVCGHRYQEGGSVASLGLCGCGIAAIGMCTACSRPLCGDHALRNPRFSVFDLAQRNPNHFQVRPNRYGWFRNLNDKEIHVDPPDGPEIVVDCQYDAFSSGWHELGAGGRIVCWDCRFAAAKRAVAQTPLEEFSADPLHRALEIKAEGCQEQSPDPSALIQSFLTNMAARGNPGLTAFQVDGHPAAWFRMGPRVQEVLQNFGRNRRPRIYGWYLRVVDTYPGTDSMGISAAILTADGQLLHASHARRVGGPKPQEMALQSVKPRLLLNSLLEIWVKEA